MLEGFLPVNFLFKFRGKIQKIIWTGEAIAHNKEQPGFIPQDPREPEMTSQSRNEHSRSLGGREDRMTYVIKLFGRFNK